VAAIIPSSGVGVLTAFARSGGWASMTQVVIVVQAMTVPVLFMWPKGPLSLK